MNNHTPVPWEVDGGGIYDARGNLIAVRYSGKHREKADGYGDIQPIEADANTRFIVRACNSHGKLLEALKAMEAVSHRLHGCSHKPCVPCDENDAAVELAHAAITEATGGKP